MINTIASGFSYKGQFSQSHKHQLHAIWDIDINYVDTPSPQSLPSITFIDRDFKGINPINQDDPMVVSIIIDNFRVSKVLID